MPSSIEMQPQSREAMVAAPLSEEQQRAAETETKQEEKKSSPFLWMRGGGAVGEWYVFLLFQSAMVGWMELIVA
ncbi:hypothetical protein MMC10_010738 [Thelotrema lepadinum]|nr:hypothetical protein [Thelotrema lepadinum]